MKNKYYSLILIFLILLSGIAGARSQIILTLTDQITEPDSVIYDASVAGIIYPYEQVCQTYFSPVISLANYSTDTLAGVEITYRLDSSSFLNFSWTGHLAEGSAILVSLPPINCNQGNHILRVYCSNPNGHPDLFNSNDTAWRYFYILGTNDGIMPAASEGFEESSFPPVDWVIDNPEGDTHVWKSSHQAGGYGLSTTSACFPNSECYPDGTRDYLISPWFNMIPFVNSILYFDYAYSAPPSATLPSFSDTLAIYYSANCSGNWIKIWEKGGTALATSPAIVPFHTFIPSPSDWTTDTIILTGIGGNPLVQFRFENRSGYGNDLFLDNINFNFPTGISLHPADDIKVYPNILSGTTELNVKIPLIIQAYFELFDVTGAVLFHHRLNGGLNKVRLFSLTSGLYFYRIINKSGCQSKGKIMITGS